MTNEIRTSIIGFGMSARVFHAPVILTIPEFRITKVVERHREESRAHIPGVEVVRETDALLEDDEIDLVIITTPNDTHYDLARRALMAGKHVVVDKPFTTTSVQAAELIQLASRKNRIINVFQNRRWDADFQTVQMLLDRGYLGRLVELESHFDRFREKRKPNSWRENPGEGSGVFFDLGPHLIDQALVLFGPPQMVTADIRSQRDDALTDDNFELILHYDRLKVTLKSGMLVRAETPRFLLHGTNGSFVKYGMDPQEDALKGGRSPSEPGWGAEPEQMWGRLDTEMNGMHFSGRVETIPGNYRGYYQNVADAIRGSSELMVSPTQMEQTIRIIELAFQSNEEMRTVPFIQG
ncbi:MAG: oxidoreductase [Balneolaceae bacterium]|nr:MAG: oxidoreductase [Balneolaceae bacterium]